MAERDEAEFAIAWQDYVDRHGKEPASGDSSDIEAVDLYRWMFRTRQLSEREGLSEMTARRLDLLCPSWRPQPVRRTQQSEHRAFARAYRDFVMRTKRAPWARSADPRDRELAQWFLGVKEAFKAGEVPTSVVRGIEEFLPGWTRTRHPLLKPVRPGPPGQHGVRVRALRKVVEPFESEASDDMPSAAVQRIESIATFLAAHDRLPAVGGVGTESELAAWLAECFTSADDALQERLDYTFPGWREEYAPARPRLSEADDVPAQGAAMTQPTGERPDEGKSLVGYIDSRDSLDELDLTVIAADKNHPGLAQRDPYSFARLVLEGAEAQQLSRS